MTIVRFDGRDYDIPPEVPLHHTEGSIRMISGRLINPFTMTEDDVDVRDIVIGLANTARYNGQTLFPYSVAQHSCLLHDWARDNGQPAQVQRAFLLHDAAEILISDVPRPIKHDPRVARVIKPLELYVSGVIAKRFEIEELEPQVVKDMDYDIVCSEKIDLQPYGFLDAMQYFPNGPKHRFEIEEWSFAQARSEFAGRMLEHFPNSFANDR